MRTKRLYCVVEAPDGRTWEQEIELRDGESANAAIARYKRMLGKSYWICDWHLS